MTHNEQIIEAQKELIDFYEHIIFINLILVLSIVRSLILKPLLNNMRAKSRRSIWISTPEMRAQWKREWDFYKTYKEKKACEYIYRQRVREW